MKSCGAPHVQTCVTYRLEAVTPGGYSSQPTSWKRMGRFMGVDEARTVCAYDVQERQNRI
jgi:hypothetical protein